MYPHLRSLRGMLLIHKLRQERKAEQEEDEDDRGAKGRSSSGDAEGVGAALAVGNDEQSRGRLAGELGRSRARG